MSKIANMWVIQLDYYAPGPYYRLEYFRGGTYDIERAMRFEAEPKPLLGKAVPVKVTTTVEVVT